MVNSDDIAVLSKIITEMKLARKRIDNNSIRLRRLIDEFESELHDLLYVQVSDDPR